MSLYCLQVAPLLTIDRYYPLANIYCKNNNNNNCITISVQKVRDYFRGSNTNDEERLKQTFSRGSDTYCRYMRWLAPDECCKTVCACMGVGELLRPWERLVARVCLRACMHSSMKVMSMNAITNVLQYIFGQDETTACTRCNSCQQYLRNVMDKSRMTLRSMFPKYMPSEICRSPLLNNDRRHAKMVTHYMTSRKHAYVFITSRQFNNIDTQEKLTCDM